MTLETTPTSRANCKTSGKRLNATGKPRGVRVALPVSQRSAVTNGNRLHVANPGDHAWSRRFRDVLAQILADISGPEHLSEAQRQLARRAATICIACEKMEGEAAAGNDIDADLFGQMTDRLGRCFNRLGIKRTSRDGGTLTLDQYLTQRQGGAE